MQKQKFTQIREGFQSDEIRDYIDPYIELVTRNEKEINEEIHKLVEKHLDRIPKNDFPVSKTSRELEILSVRDLYEKAIDPDNPKRD
jgi:hypothetical protein